MQPGLRVLLGLAGVTLLAWVFFKLRRRRLRISLGCLFAGLALIFGITAAFPKTFDFVAAALGIDYPPIFFFMVGIFLLFVIVGELATQISTNDQRFRVLNSEFACLKAKLEALEKKGAKDDPETPAPGAAPSAPGAAGDDQVPPR